VRTLSSATMPSEQEKRLAKDMNRWVVGAYRGSRADKVQALCGVSDSGDIMATKRIRWAASVYGRHIPELREIVEPILREVVEVDAELRRMRGSKGANTCGNRRAVPGPPRERRFARGPGPAGAYGSKLSANNLFFFELLDSGLRL